MLWPKCRWQDGATGSPRFGSRVLSVNCSLFDFDPLLPLLPPALYQVQKRWLVLARSPTAVALAESRDVHDRFVAAHLP